MPVGAVVGLCPAQGFRLSASGRLSSLDLSFTGRALSLAMQTTSRVKSRVVA